MSVLYLIGDSTCATKSETARPETGWGEAFGEFIRSGWSIDNRALNGRSTKSFISEGLFQSVLDCIKSGDAAIIQFGHNDSKPEEARFSAPFTGYVDNLVFMAEKLKEKGAFVYFLTSIARRQFEDGLIVQTHGEYPSAMHYAGFKASVPVVDMTTVTMVGLEKIGEEKSRKLFMNLDKGEYPNYPDGKEDDTHLTPSGAKWISLITARELAKLEEIPPFLANVEVKAKSEKDYTLLETVN